MENIEFNLDSASFAEEGYVYRKGLIFRAGQYADKNFEMSPEELLAAANEFEPVPLDVEHMPSIFDSKLGSLLAVEPSADGWELYGVAKIPKWLNDLHGGEFPLKVSCTWTRDSKKLSKLALVKNPRVGDAALMAAFTANELESSSTEDHFKNTVLNFLSWVKDNNITKENTFDGYERESPGQSTLQTIHDICAAAGAICDPNNVETEEDDDEENGNGMQGKMRPSMYKDSDFVSRKESETFQRIHDLITKQGAKCYPDPKTFNNNKNEDSIMSGLKDVIEKLTALSGKLPETAVEVPETSAPVQEIAEPVANHSASSNEVEQLKAQLSEAQAQLSKLAEEKAQAEEEKVKAETELLNAEADKFAEDLVTAKKITPASADFAKKLFLVGKTSTATFNNDEPLLNLIQGLFDSLETHNFTDEVMSDVAVLGAKPVKVDELEEARKLAEEYAKKASRTQKENQQ